MDYYKRAGITLTLEPEYLCMRLNFGLGNIVKYVTRAKHKGNMIGDLKKAIDYAEREAALMAEVYAPDELRRAWTRGDKPDLADRFIEKYPLLGLLFISDRDGASPHAYVSGNSLRVLIAALRKEIQNHEADQTDDEVYVYDTSTKRHPKTPNV